MSKEEGYLCPCGHFNTDNDLCDHSPCLCCDDNKIAWSDCVGCDDGDMACEACCTCWVDGEKELVVEE